MTLRDGGHRIWVFGLRPSFSTHTSTRMVRFEVNLAPRKKTVKSNIYISKRADTTRINKELQEFANYFEVMKNESVNHKVEHVSTKAYWHNGFLHTAQVPHGISYHGLAAV